MKKINFYDVICSLILRGKTCQSTASLLFMITPPFSWIFTKYANEWPPRKKINTKKEPEVVNTKKDQHEKRTGSCHHEKRSGSGQHEKGNRKWSTRKRKPEVTRDLWPLTLTRKRSNLTTDSPNKDRWFLRLIIKKLKWIDYLKTILQ